MASVESLPPDLPFRIISKTIGRGAYASIKKAIPLDSSTPVFAVKFIHKGYAVRNGRISSKQLAMESSLHSHVGQHSNVIEWFASGEDAVWRWVAMEFAEGGDLFDKIEADVGVPPDIGQIYFMQLVSGLSFIHSKGVAHRDLKPENIMLSGEGILKLADFGMATMFEYKGQRKTSGTLCGSPPYIAPEILACGGGGGAVGPVGPGGPAGKPAARRPAAAAPPQPARYSPDVADIWSCGVILFVLLVGNTPWDEPSGSSWEYQEYVRTSGRSTDSLWARIPADALSLLRGMMCVDPARRFDAAKIRQHPWATRPNPLLSPDGGMLDPITVATRMLENLHVDLSQGPDLPSSQSDPPAAEMPSPRSAAAAASAISFSQPEAPISDVAWDFERPTLRMLGAGAPPSTQPVRSGGASGARDAQLIGAGGGGAAGLGYFSFLADEPAMSQFSQNPGASMTMTQQARRFGDIVPAESLTRFLSHVPAKLAVEMLSDALHQLNVPLQRPHMALDPTEDHVATLRIRASDGRHQRLHGEISVDRLRLPAAGGDEDEPWPAPELLEVRFSKVTGDPLEWRRFFKKVVVLCKEAVYVPDA